MSLLHCTPADPPILPFAQSGTGPDVVLIHGAMTCFDDMAIALFASLDNAFRMTAFDRPGHGRSHEPFSGTAWQQADAIHASGAALGLVRPVIVGHSFGAVVALAYALRYPEAVSGVVALSPIAFPEPRLEQVIFAPRALPGPGGFWLNSFGRLTDPVLLPMLWRGMFRPQAMPPRFAEVFPFGQAGRAGQMLAEAQDAALMLASVSANVAGYRSCRAPVHILAGDQDRVVNPAIHAAGLARSLPRGRLTLLPGLGHMIHHFAQPVIAQALGELHAAT